MTVDSDKIDRTDRDYTKYLPLVRTRKGEFSFVPELIYRSLLKETELTEVDAKKVTEQVIFVIIEIPMARNLNNEISNLVLF